MLRDLQNSAFSQWVVGSDTLLAYPTILTLHTVGLAMVVGAAIVVDLRTMGVGADIPIGTMRSAFKILWIGFAINLLSGLTLFASEAVDKGTQPVFYIKLVLIAAAVIVTFRLKPEATPEVASGFSRKNLAILSMVLWGAAIVAGRLMAYL